MSQVGVGTDNPSSKAILHMESSDKGLIIPKMTNAQMDAMTVGGNPETGTLVYNTDVNEIFAFKNGKWYSMTPFQRERSSNVTKDTIVAASTSAGNPLKVTSLHATSGYGIVPLGTIVMWSGIENTIPDGWALCDGDVVNGYKTPNLSGRFVVGYNSSDTDYDQPGNLSQNGTTTADIGGLTSVELTNSQMPKHNHGGSTVAVGNHQHGYSDRYIIESAGITGMPTGTASYAHGTGQNIGNEGLDGNNTHFYYVGDNTGYAGGHSHVINNDGGSASKTAEPHENRPPYYTLAFIMRVK